MTTRPVIKLEDKQLLTTDNVRFKLLKIKPKVDSYFTDKNKQVYHSNTYRQLRFSRAQTLPRSCCRQRMGAGSVQRLSPPRDNA